MRRCAGFMKSSGYALGMYSSALRDVAQDVELGRRITHALGGLPAAFFFFDVITWDVLGAILWIGVLIVFLLEYLRLKQGVTHVIYRRLTRPYEATSVAAYAYYAVGMGLAWVLYPPSVALVGMAALAFGDPISGSLSSPNDPTHRRILSAVGIATVTFTTTLVVLTGHSQLATMALACVAGAVAVVSDMYAFTVRGTMVDDNLLLPLLPSGVLAVVLALISFLP